MTAVIVQSDKGFECFGKIKEAFYCREPEWMLSGPFETGKTYTALMKLHLLACKYENGRGLILRKTYASLINTAVVTYEKKVLPISIDSPDCPIKKFGGERPEFYSYPNGSRLALAGLDNPVKALSSEWDWIYVPQAEELALGEWETLTSRTSGRAGNTPYPQIFGDCNPGPPQHWILHRDRLKVFYSKHEDNPRLFDHKKQEWTAAGKQTLATLDALTGVRYKRGRLGLWVSAEGQVYETYDPAVHVVRRFEIPITWRRIRAIDFGYKNPFVCSWYAIDHDDNLYQYREIYQTGGLVEDFARQIVQLSAGENIEVTVADHDLEDRKTLEKHGVSTVAAQKDIKSGREAVESRLGKPGHSKPSLFFMADSLVSVDESLRDAHLPLCTTDEFSVYIWPKGVDGKPIKEIPIDLNNHGMDQLRYAVKYADNPNAITVESAPDYITERY